MSNHIISYSYSSMGKNEWPFAQPKWLTFQPLFLPAFVFFFSHCFFKKNKYIMCYVDIRSFHKIFIHFFHSYSAKHSPIFNLFILLLFLFYLKIYSTIFLCLITFFATLILYDIFEIIQFKKYF